VDTGPGSLVFSPAWQTVLADLDFTLLNTLKIRFSLRNNLFLFPSFLSPRLSSRDSTAAQFQIMTAPVLAGSHPAHLKAVLTCNFPLLLHTNWPLSPPYCSEPRRRATAKDHKLKPCVNCPRGYPVTFCDCTLQNSIHAPFSFPANFCTEIKLSLCC